ncbi:hypothetical protein F5B20DRAFT_246589 [Whalleya microplaca]|nr:hypothetical protein F5B20DRAFT_246589 [Whalleya microplaca]
MSSLSDPQLPVLEVSDSNMDIDLPVDAIDTGATLRSVTQHSGCRSGIVEGEFESGEEKINATLDSLEDCVHSAMDEVVDAAKHYRVAYLEVQRMRKKLFEPSDKLFDDYHRPQSPPVDMAELVTSAEHSDAYDSSGDFDRRAALKAPEAHETAKTHWGSWKPGVTTTPSIGEEGEGDEPQAQVSGWEQEAPMDSTAKGDEQNTRLIATTTSDNDKVENVETLESEPRERQSSEHPTYEVPGIVDGDHTKSNDGTGENLTDSAVDDEAILDSTPRVGDILAGMSLEEKNDEDAVQRIFHRPSPDTKICFGCLQVRPLGQFKQRNAKHTYCASCMTAPRHVRLKNRAYAVERLNNEIKGSGYKVCSYCNSLKPLQDYGTERRYFVSCPACRLAKRKRSYSPNVTEPSQGDSKPRFHLMLREVGGDDVVRQEYENDSMTMEELLEKIKEVEALEQRTASTTKKPSSKKRHWSSSELDSTFKKARNEERTVAVPTGTTTRPSGNITPLTAAEPEEMSLRGGSSFITRRAPRRVRGNRPPRRLPRPIDYSHNGAYDDGDDDDVPMRPTITNTNTDTADTDADLVTWLMSTTTLHPSSHHPHSPRPNSPRPSASAPHAGIWAHPQTPRTYANLANWEVWLADKYVSGTPIQTLSRRLDLGIGELLPHARLCLVLCCEHACEAFAGLARDPVRWPSFVAALSPCVQIAADGAEVGELCDVFPALRALLHDYGCRRRVIWAFQNVDLSQLGGEEKKDDVEMQMEPQPQPQPQPQPTPAGDGGGTGDAGEDVDMYL